MTSPRFGPDAAGTPVPPPPPARGFRRRDTVIAGVVAVVLVAGVGSAVAVAVAHDGDRSAATRQAPTAPSSPAPGSSAAAPAQLADVLPALQAFVTAERGLPFIREVKVELLDDAAFDEALAGDAPTGEDQARIDGFVSTLLAFGLVETREEADEAIESGGDDVVGFYRFETRQLSVRAAKGLTAYAQGTLVHELTHALQDQHFSLSRPELERADDERGTAFRTLFEGDATRVEQAWYDAQPRDVRQAYDTEEEALIGDREDEDLGAVEELSYYPYVAGLQLVEALLDDGGQARLDEAFRHPPATTEQLFDLDAPAPLTVDPPDTNDDRGLVPPGGRVVDKGMLGEQGLALILWEYSWDPDVATLWRGDSYVTTEVDGQLCTRVNIATASAADATELRKMLDNDYRVFTVGTDRLSVHSCGDDEGGAGGTGA